MASDSSPTWRLSVVSQATGKHQESKDVAALAMFAGSENQPTSSLAQLHVGTLLAAGALDPFDHRFQVVCPEDGESPILGIHQVGERVDPFQDCRWDDL